MFFWRVRFNFKHPHTPNNLFPNLSSILCVYRCEWVCHLMKMIGLANSPEQLNIDTMTQRGYFRHVQTIPQRAVWLQAFVPTSQEHTIWPMSFLKTETSWLNKSGLVCCCLVEKKTCSHIGPLWNSLDMAGLFEHCFLNICLPTHIQTNPHIKPTILGEFGGADQCGDSEAVSGADRQASPTTRQSAGAAAQCCRLVGVTVVVAGRGQRQVGVHILHALAVTLRGECTGVRSNVDTPTSLMMVQMFGGCRWSTGTRDENHIFCI